MDTVSVLFPPNGLHLSGDVIGSVIARVPASRIGFGSIDTIQCSERIQAHHTESHPLRTDDFVENPNSDDQTICWEDIASLIVQGRESKRTARRECQRRYRKKQNDHLISLEQETEELRQSVKRLQQHRLSLTATGIEDDCAWKVVVEYFRVFEHGLREQPYTQQPSSTYSMSEGTIPSEQLKFLWTQLASDVVYNGHQGVNAAIYSWRRTSYWCKDFNLELVALRNEGAGLLVATSETSFTITERTLRNVFPGIWNGRGDSLRSPLVNKLLGQRIVMGGTVHFQWDKTRGCVASVVSLSDLMTPMLRLLGSLTEVEQVFSNAIICPDFTWTKGSSISSD